ncbi:hypothetical protein AT239_08065 [Bartonella henselae]|nr:hypothetical protein AT239_08065 [Bartonella henselae]OLL54792.1 hypothetical protein AT240_07795 [Bartonella henselae]
MMVISNVLVILPSILVLYFFIIQEYQRCCKILTETTKEREELIKILQQYMRLMEAMSSKIDRFKPRFFLTSPIFKVRPGEAIPLQHVADAEVIDPYQKECLRNAVMEKTLQE